MRSLHNSNFFSPERCWIILGPMVSFPMVITAPKTSTGRRQILRRVLLKLKKCHATRGFHCATPMDMIWTPMDILRRVVRVVYPISVYRIYPRNVSIFRSWRLMAPEETCGFQNNIFPTWKGLAVARRVHMWINIDQIHMTFFRYQVCNKGCQVMTTEMFFLLEISWECCTFALLPQCKRVRYC